MESFIFRKILSSLLHRNKEIGEMEKGYYSILRVSHLSQIGNFSIEQQKESIEAYADLHSIEITEHLAECGSGTTGERKQIQTLYRLISEDRVEGILCYKLDRIFRNMKLSIDFISICVEKGIKIHSVAENISTDTPAGWDVHGQLPVVGESICRRQHP